MSDSRAIQPTNPGGPAAGADDESASAVLRFLAAQRGPLLTDAEYERQRRAILAELAEGARLRPFTWFTFAVIEVGLAGLAAVGLVAGRGSGDYLLAAVCLVALLCAASVFFQMLRSVRRDRERSLEERLQELEEVRAQHLITTDEYHEIQARILSARQHGTKLRA